ncbi:MAG: hypothetical protein ACLRSV_09565 [Oscillospiraceae bacterium]
MTYCYSVYHDNFRDSGWAMYRDSQENYRQFGVAAAVRACQEIGLAYAARAS